MAPPPLRLVPVRGAPARVGPVTPDSAALLVVLFAALWLALVAWGVVEHLTREARRPGEPDDSGTRGLRNP